MKLKLHPHVAFAIWALLIAPTPSAPERVPRSPFVYEVGVFYFPLNSSSYAPITTSELVKCQDITSLVQNRLGDLIAWCKTATDPGAFDRDQVRLRIILPRGEEYLVDMEGDVLHVGADRRHTETVTKLSREDRKSLHKCILGSFLESNDYYAHEKPR